MDNRNYGIDFLKILSMLMIVVLHFFGHTSISTSLIPFSCQDIFVNFSCSICFCAVNCYAMISGYVYINSKYKWTNMIMVWLQTLFYSLTISVAFMFVFKDAVGLKDIIKSAFPICENKYWYVSSYFGMFLFIPVINSGVNHLNSKQAKSLLMVLAIAVSIIPTWFKDVLYLNKGYSALWLIIMYIFGACIAKFDFFSKSKKKYIMLALFVSVAIVFVYKLLCEFFSKGHNSVSKILTVLLQNINVCSYTSLFAVVLAVSFLVLFKGMKFNGFSIRVISFFAPLTFGVYLIHDNELIRNNVLKNSFASLADLNPVGFVCASLGCVFAIFIICSLIDFIRKKIFDILKFKSLVNFVENKLPEVLKLQ